MTVNSFTMSSGNLAIDLSGSGCDRLTATSTLTGAVKVTLNNLLPLTATEYFILGYASGSGPAFTITNPTLAAVRFRSTTPSTSSKSR